MLCGEHNLEPCLMQPFSIIICVLLLGTDFTAAFCALATMTLSTAAGSAPSDSPNCVVRCLEHQLAATTLGMSPSSSSAKEGGREERHHHQYDDAVGYGSNLNSSSPIKQEEEEETTATTTATTAVVTLETPLKDVRNMIFQLCALTGSLSTLFWQQMPPDHEHHNTTSTSTTPPKQVVDVMAQLLQQLMKLSAALSIDLGKACLTKIGLNNRKYPVELCKGKAGKYTQYSQATGITKTTGQSTATAAIRTTSDSDGKNREDNSDWKRHFLDAPWTEIAARTRQFAVQREWGRYHTPRNLLLALTGELGELAEIFQWKGDADDGDSAAAAAAAGKKYHGMAVAEHDKVGQELADVTIYLCRLADVCGVALADETKQRTVE